jgi:Na+-driven multidrug efflux pump
MKMEWLVILFMFGMLAAMFAPAAHNRPLALVGFAVAGISATVIAVQVVLVYLRQKKPIKQNRRPPV